MVVVKDEPVGTAAFMDNSDVEVDDDTFTILLGTDIHLGHKKDDPVRWRDSFLAFEELLQHAKTNDVDFLLFGGDLFDENNPPVKVVKHAIRLLHENICGQKPVKFTVISDAARNFGHSCPDTQDPHWLLPWINISYPVLSIHGNHDNPTGDTNLSAIDLLATQGLLSHFGKLTELDKIVIEPVLLQKGRTKIALYGIGSQKDERLHYMFKNGLVYFHVPDSDDYFNILIIHQNRVARSSRHDCIPESFIPRFIDLVLWGHEHDDLFGPNYSSPSDCWITQPGSTVPTSLTVGESAKKSVGLLTVKLNKFRLDRLELETSRIMIVRDLRLSDYLNPEDDDVESKKRIEEVKEILRNEVNSMILAANEKRRDCSRAPKLPLLRLRIDKEPGFPSINAAHFGDQFKDKAANRDILLVKKDKSISIKTADKQIDEDIKSALTKNETSIIQLIEHHLVNNNPMKCLAELSLASLTQKLVEEKINGTPISYAAIGELIQKQKECIIEEVRDNFSSEVEAPKDREIDRYLEHFRENHMKDYSVDEDVRSILDSYIAKGDVSPARPQTSDDDDEPQVKRGGKTGRGRGRGRGRAKK